MKAKPRASDESRFQNLVALVGTVNRCADCRQEGLLVEVGVQAEPIYRQRRYFAEWEHPHRDDPATTTICEWWWP